MGLALLSGLSKATGYMGALGTVQTDMSAYDTCTTPPPQVVAHYVAMTPNLRVFDSSLDKGSPYDIR